MSEFPIYLLDVASDAAVEASLIEGIAEANVHDWEDAWMPALASALQQLKEKGVDRRFWPQNRHWDWRRKAEAFKGLLAAPSFSIVCQGMTQGLMIVETLESCRLPQQKGKPLVYIQYLETAPWNRPGLATDRPRLKGVGTLLVRAAIELSRNEAFGGRIGLHSLPQANAWYANVCGMSDLGIDPTKENLRYFEMTPEQAEAFIAKGV